MITIPVRQIPYRVSDRKLIELCVPDGYTVHGEEPGETVFEIYRRGSEKVAEASVTHDAVIIKFVEGINKPYHMQEFKRSKPFVVWMVFYSSGNGEWSPCNGLVSILPALAMEHVTKEHIERIAYLCSYEPGSFDRKRSRLSVISMQLIFFNRRLDKDLGPRALNISRG